jgi:Leucine-rich repeat (LRR) protein
LKRLSLENNQIFSVPKEWNLSINIRELYMGNNNIESIKEISPIFDYLKDLIVFDLSGNYITEEYEYRPYCIYNMKNLKILDGLVITSAEKVYFLIYMLF